MHSDDVRRRRTRSCIAFVCGVVCTLLLQRVITHNADSVPPEAQEERLQDDWAHTLARDDSSFASALSPASITIPFPDSEHDAETREDFIQLENSGLADAAPHTSSYVTACVIVKDAVETLPEFVVRNRLAGVDHFVIVDDSDPHGFELLHRVLEPMSAFVSLVRMSRDVPLDDNVTDWSSRVQISANFECARSVASWSEWVAFIDVDEFFEASSPAQFGVARNPSTPFLREYLRAHGNAVPALCFLWKTVLTNGKFDPAPCGESLARWFPMACNATRYLGVQQSPLARSKTVARVRYLNYADTPLDDGFAHIGYRFLAPFEDFQCNSTGTEKDIVLVHYWSGSLLDYIRKIARGRPRRPKEKRTIFELLLREFLCFPQVMEYSSILRSGAVMAAMRELGYKCNSSISIPLPGEDLLRGVKDSAALSFAVAQVIQGKTFNASQYDVATNLSYKGGHARHMSHLDRIPWAHFYMYGFAGSDGATREEWFT
jgi:hypothetical protein